MKLIYHPYLLEFKHPFGVSSNTRTHTPVVFTRIEQDGIYGYGEACVPTYLGETQEGTISFLQRAQELLGGYGLPTEDLTGKIDALAPDNNAAKASIDIALHDLKGKLEGKTFRQMQGLQSSKPVSTSCTIGIDHADKIAIKIKEAEAFSILKIKAGSENDKALINLVRAHTNKPLYVDVNQGWKDKYFVLDMLHYLKENNVVLAEQPMPVSMLEEMAWVTERSPIPTIADESVKRLADIDKVKGVFSGINIKLMKSGGLTEALKMIKRARENNLKVMLGCMAESSCGTTAMAQLASLADYVDLDAPNLIKNDPFSGIFYKEGKVLLNNSPGIGVELKDKNFFNS